MNRIKFLRSAPVYPGYIQQVYLDHKELCRASYEEQYSVLMRGVHSWSDFWKKHLEATGSFKVKEILSNVVPLQKQWAREHGVHFRSECWQGDILGAQVRDFRPQVFFTENYGKHDVSMRLNLKEAIPDLLVMGYDGMAMHDPVRFKGCDIILSCLGVTLDYYRKAGFETLPFRLGFESNILERLKPGSGRYPVSFIGSIHFGLNCHSERLNLLSILSKATPIELWLMMPSLMSCTKTMLGLIKKGQFSYFISSSIKQFPQMVTLSRKIHGPIFGKEMYQTLADSKISINCHIDAAGQEAGNMRLFESTGVGSCLVTDMKENLSDLFDIDSEVVAYRSLEECVEKVKFLMANDEIRQNIAKRGQQRTLRQHSLKEQIRKVGEFIIKRL